MHDLTMGPSQNHDYLYQLARAARFFQRLLDRTVPLKGLDAGMIAYEDDLWSFFIHCWHVRDWVQHDESLASEARDRIERAVHASPALCVCADIANGRKHMWLRHSRTGAEPNELRLTPTSPAHKEFIPEVFISLGPGDGQWVTALDAARAALTGWKEILEAEGLALPAAFPTGDLAPTGQWFPDGIKGPPGHRF